MSLKRKISSKNIKMTDSFSVLNPIKSILEGDLSISEKASKILQFRNIIGDISKLDIGRDLFDEIHIQQQKFILNKVGDIIKENFKSNKILFRENILCNNEGPNESELFFDLDIILCSSDLENNIFYFLSKIDTGDIQITQDFIIDLPFGKVILSAPIFIKAGVPIVFKYNITKIK